MSPPLAVIVGIAEHAAPHLALQTPVRDAEALAALLREQHGYEVVLRRDGEAARAGLERLFEAELPAMVDAERRVLVYFAGHGAAIPSLDAPSGYLVPTDGGDDLGSLYPMARLRAALEALPCRHLLLLLDCCFGGAFRWAAGRDFVAAPAPELYRQRYERYLASPAWQVITSAAHDERASDWIAGMALHRPPGGDGGLHSPFFEALRDGLAGDADLGTRARRQRGDGVITATELYLYLRDRLEEERPGAPAQTPQLWLFSRHGKGEYIFHVPGRAPDLPEAAPLGRESSPYRGLEAYEREHAPLFHGRAAATAALLARVERRPITVVVGRSGTGKSSLVQAGLIPAIERRHRGWQIEGPLRAAEAIGRLEALAAGDVEAASASEAASVEAGAGAARDREVSGGEAGVVEAASDVEARDIEAASGGEASGGEASGGEASGGEASGVEAAPARAIVLVIEHLEELFDAPERGGPERFLGALAAAAARPGVRVVGTLRDDLETELWASSLGARWPEVRFPLADMTREELREAIERPAEQRVLTFDPPDMVDRLIDSVVAMPGALPLLSFTLDKLYLECVARADGDRRLVEGDRLDTGGLALALRAHADALHDRLDEAGRDTMRRILLRLVTVKQGAVTRRRAALDELRFADPDEQRRVHAVLYALTGKAPRAAGAAGALPASAPPGPWLAILGGEAGSAGGGEGGFVELAHDAVARDWPRLRAWWTAAQAELLLLRRFAAAAEEWARAGRPGELLWADRRRLAEVRGSLTAARPPAGAAPGPLASPHALNQREAAFYRRGRRARRARLAIGWGAAAVGLAALLVVVDRSRAARAAQASAAASERIQQGGQASELARIPGKEQEALTTAVTALDGAIAAGHEIDPAILRGAMDAAGYRRVELPFPQPGDLRRVECSADGARFAASMADGAIVVVGSGGLRRLPHAHDPGAPPGAGAVDKGEHAVAAFMPDEEAIAVGDDLGRVRLWSYERGLAARRVGDQGSAINAINTSPDGRYIVTGGKDGSVYLWARDGTGARTLAASTGDAVTALAFSADGGRLAASSLGGTARVWSVSDGGLELEAPSAPFEDSFDSVDLSPDGWTLVTSGARTMIWRLDAPDGAPWSLGALALSARFSAGEQELIAWDGERTLARWDLRSLRKLGPSLRSDPDIARVRYCGPRLAVVTDQQGSSHIRGLERDNAIEVLGAGARSVVAVTFTPDGSSVIAGLRTRSMFDLKIERWSVGGAAPGSAPSTSRDSTSSPAPLASGLRRDVDLVRLALAPDGRVLVETRDGPSLVWNLERDIAAASGRDDYKVITRAQERQPGLEDPGEDPSDTARVVTRLGRAPRQRSTVKVARFSSAGGPRLRVYSDGKLEVLSPGGLALGDLGLGEQTVATRYDHGGAVNAVAVSPDGRRFATASDDGTARLWDAATGELWATLYGHEGPVRAVAFSDDGERVATGGDDGTLRVFPVTPGGILELACSRLAAAAPAAFAEVAGRCGADGARAKPSP